MMDNIRYKRINMHKGDKKEKEGVDGLKKNCQSIITDRRKYKEFGKVRKWRH